MKIVSTSNYDRDTYSESVVAENITNRVLGERMCYALNKYDTRSEHYYQLLPDNYILKKYEP